jgi:hypothetical protein
VVWRGDDGNVAESPFQVAADAAGATAIARYDRGDPLALAPFPDDYYTVADAGQASGVRLEMPAQPFEDEFQAQPERSSHRRRASTVGAAWRVVLAFSHPLDPAGPPTKPHRGTPSRRSR